MVNEIKEWVGIEKVSSLDDVLKVRDFCFHLIPWTPIPYEMKLDKDLFEIGKRFKKKEIGGWCGLDATYFSHLMWHVYDLSKIECEPFNYGLKDFSHVTIVVRLNEEDEFLIDPYFCRHYVYENGDPIKFKDLILLIFNREFDKIFDSFGNSLKFVYQESTGDFLEWKPEDLLNSVMNSWIQLKGYESFMGDLYNSTNSKLLMLSRIF